MFYELHNSTQVVAGDAAKKWAGLCVAPPRRRKGGGKAAAYAPRGALRRLVRRYACDDAGEAYSAAYLTSTTSFLR
jgi:coenzyme F420-reducing hydrogenase alpha subunit